MNQMNHEHAPLPPKDSVPLVKSMDLDRAARLLGRSCEVLEKYCVDQTCSSLTEDAITTLEAAVGEPNVTSAFANLNAPSVRREEKHEARRSDLNSSVVALTKAFSELMTAHQASSSGPRSRDQARALTKDVEGMLSALVDMKLRLVGVPSPVDHNSPCATEGHVLGNGETGAQHSQRRIAR